MPLRGKRLERDYREGEDRGEEGLGRGDSTGSCAREECLEAEDARKMP